MKHTIGVVPLTESGLEKLSKKLDEIESWLDQKSDELVDRLAQEGTEAAQFGFDIAVYDGVKDAKVRPEKRGEKTAAVIAEGESVLFMEFGSGVTLGYGHPEPLEYGPGTYPGKGHWNDPNGWYLPKDAQKATGIEHSVGNPPAMAMYNARKELEQNLERIAREVFNS